MLGVGVALLTLGIGFLYASGARSIAAWTWIFFGSLVVGFGLLSHFGVWTGVGQRRPVTIVGLTGAGGFLLCAGIAVILIWASSGLEAAWLVLECQPWMKRPIDPQAVVVRLQPDPGMMAINRTEYFRASSWPKIPFEKVHFGSINRWQLTNYGPMPVLKVAMTLTLNFREGPNSSTSKVVVSRQWPINIQKIDPGASSPFVFYLANRSRHTLEIIPSESATLEVLGETQRRTIAIKRTDKTYYDLAAGIPPDVGTDSPAKD